MGAFPTWLAPEQVRIIPVNNDEAVVNLAEKLNKRLLKHSIRSKIDSRNEKLSYKIHDSQVFKVPYTIVLGNKEAEANQITYRLYHEQQSKTVAFDEFVKIILKDIKTKAVKRSY